jgi:hypothetical protein
MRLPQVSAAAAAAAFLAVRQLVAAAVQEVAVQPVGQLLRPQLPVLVLVVVAAAAVVLQPEAQQLPLQQQLLALQEAGLQQQQLQDGL